MTLKFYCPNCEILCKTIMINSRDGKFNCADCMLAFDFEITVQPRKTYDEVTTEFERIPLTKNQRTGSGNKPYKRKRTIK